MHPLALWGAQASPLKRQTHPSPSRAPTMVAVSLLLSDPAGCAPPQLPAIPEHWYLLFVLLDKPISAAAASLPRCRTTQEVYSR